MSSIPAQLRLKSWSLIISWMVISLVWGVAWSVMKIGAIECSYNRVACSDEIISQLSPVLGQSYWQVDWSRQLSDWWPLTVIDVKRRLPTELVIHLTSQSGFAQPEALSSSNSVSTNQELSVALTGFLANVAEKGFSRSQIQTFDQVVVISFQESPVGQFQIIIDRQHWLTNTRRAQLILNHLDLTTIDLQLKELDVRYRLPVLRTTISQLTLN